MTGVDPLIGRDLDGRYTITGTIGRGGMGAVYRATQLGIGREVAVKVVTPRLAPDHVIIKRFLREARLASKLMHPNAVTIFDFGQTADELIYLVMELVTGRTLEETVASEGVLAPDRVVHIGAQICDALVGAHALQIIHRDLKPANIMLSTAGRDVVKVLDFGLAKSLSDVTGAALTSAGSVIGTPAFMPPESVTGGTVDGRADLYSLGCTLYFALAGRLPFEGNTVAEMIALHASEPPPSLVGAPVGLAAAIGTLLAKDPAQRYPDATATRAALEASLASTAVVTGTPRATPPKGTMLGWATPTPTPAPKPKPTTKASVAAHAPAAPAARSYRIAWLAIALVIVASVGLVVYTLLTR